MIVPVIAAVVTAVGGYEGWKKWGVSIKKALGLGHPLTNPPQAANLPSSNPSGGTILKPGTALTAIKLVGTPAVISPAYPLGTTAAGNTISGYAEDQLNTDWSATGQALFDYLKAHGNDGSTVLGGLVTAFQQAIKAQGPARISFGDYIGQTGQYDLPTAAALSVLIGDPIPSSHFVANGNSGNMPSPMVAKGQWLTQTNTTPGQAEDVNDVAADMAGTILYFFLRKYGNVKNNPIQQALTYDFQHYVNLSPMFKKHGITLTEDGDYGPASAAGLKVFGFVA